jgi:6-phosphofructokinase 1
MARRIRKIRRIALTTGGGDAPGLNAVIRGVVMTAQHHGWDCVGIRNGYDGILDARLARDGLVPLTPERVAGITNLGGTILGTTNAGNPFKYRVKTALGDEARDLSGTVLEALERAKVDALVAIGGDGSLRVAHRLSELGLRVVGVPKTIDNDLEETVITFGFDSAVSFATDCLDRLHTTAASHRRILVVEVMGRYAGWIALNSGVSGDAHAILIPEIPYDIRKVAAALIEREQAGAQHSIVVCAEGAAPLGGKPSTIERRIGRPERLGGIGERVAGELAVFTAKETRHVVLGHLLRGGPPTTFDRLLCLRFGGAAVRALAEGKSGVMVALDPPAVRYVPLARATQRMKSVPVDCDTIRTARDLGISFGD